MAKISWTDYIANNNPEGVNHVLEQFGYLPAFDVGEFSDAIDLLQEEQGNNATIELIKQHPDYDIIVSTYKQTENYQNAIGTIQENEPIQSVQQPQYKVSSDVPNLFFSSTLQNVVLVVMTFWLINKIISH